MDRRVFIASSESFMSSQNLKPLYSFVLALCLFGILLWYAIPLFAGKTVESREPLTTKFGTRTEIRIAKWLNPATGENQEVEVEVSVPYEYVETAARTVRTHYPISLKSIVVLSIVILGALILFLSVAWTTFQVHTVERKTKKEAPKHLRERYNKQMGFLGGIVTGFLSANESSDVLIPMPNTVGFDSDLDAPLDRVAPAPAPANYFDQRTPVDPVQ